VKNRFPGKNEELDTLMKEAENYSRVMLKKPGSVPPTLMALTPTGFLMYVPDSMDGEEGKDKFANAARLIAIAYKASAVAIILESWARFGNADGTFDETIAPSESPDREEVVMICAESKESKLHKVLLIQRDAKGKFAGFSPPPAPESDDFSGRFSQIMPPKEGGKENVEMAKFLLQAMGVKLTSGGFNPKWN
jgi:hypothetical protein